ncbi:MAG: 3-hydroxyacyl-CoA dehydrogenase NAD-binding domain-containing protein [Planctomycetota bacterium]
MELKKIGVIGAGQMGAGIAQVAAQLGAEVVVTDVDEARLDVGRQAISKSLGRLVKKEKLSAEEMEQTQARITWSTQLSDHSGGKLVVEAAPEIEELKCQIFKEVESHCGEDSILASNTSSISITRLASVLKRPERFIGMHFMNPVPIMPLVEVIRGAATNDMTCSSVLSLAKELGKTTTVSQDYPGFISNRILMPMINEAFFALMEGVGTAEDIDKTLTAGMGHPMGPLTLADFIGLDTCLSIMEILHGELGDTKYRPCPLLRRYVAAKWLGKKSGRGVYNYADEGAA